MMSSNLHDLISQLDRSPDRHKKFVAGIRQAIAIAAEDPEMALTRTRKVLEYVVHDVYQRSVGELPGTRPLENLLHRLKRGEHMPRRVLAHANSVRELGNVGTHATGEEITTDDVAQSISQLLLIIEWYEDAFPRDEAEADRPVGPPSATRAPRSAPPLLPHLCDRSEQEFQIDEAIRGHPGGRPLICVIHGEADQCHDEFLERLRLVTLPRSLGLARERAFIKDYVIEFPMTARDPARFRRRLLTKLSERIVDRSSVPIEEIVSAIASHRSPVLARFHLHADELTGAALSLLRCFLDFWSEWPETPTQPLLLVCLVVTYRSERGLAFLRRIVARRSNARIRKSLMELQSPTAGGLPCVLLDELIGISCNEVEAWARDEAVRRYCGRHLLHDVRCLFERPGLRGPRGRIAMEHLAAELRVILDRAGAN